ncbi:alpha/beta fold hydrolase [Rubrivirga sp. IMCC43871]|uniref:alpha/beta fold hydrolase n=1 Tax=Rubrivirga sp. IMCC43871 TaxID=3391575 RepID=UPI00398FAF62
MRPLALLLAATLALPALAQAPIAPTAPALVDAELPPLLDRDLFFGNPEITGAQLSPDGQYLTFLKPVEIDGDEVLNVWVKGIDEPFEAARPLTADARPVGGYFWSRDGAYVLYVQDKGGDENFHVWAVDPTRATGDGVPAARDLTDAEGVRAIILDVPEGDPGHILVGLNDRDPAYHDVYRVAIATGERELLIENTEQIAGWLTDLDGEIRLALRTAGDGSTEVLTVTDGAVGEVVYSCSVVETCGPVRFHPDGQRVYMQTNKGDRDLVEFILFDPATGTETLVERDPEGEVDFGGAAFSEVTNEMLATFYNGDRLRIYPKDDAFAADFDLLRELLPGGEVRPSGGTRDERTWLVSVFSDTDPGSRYLFDRDTKELTFLYRGRPELPTEHLAPMTPVRYTARDGMEIPAYLTLPQGVEAENLPTVLLVHGGPWSRDSWGYNSFAQFLANRGYAVLQPNFRGSTGYGKAFLNAGNGEWGTGAMQHDLTDGAQWLIDEGIADSERVGIMGGSYGGYATLAGLAFTPDLYAAGVDIVGPSNLITLLESIPAYWAPIRQMFYERMGDPNTPEGEAQLRAQSPLNSADQITAPLLIIQGANDPRVKQAESDQIVIALRERGYPVQYVVAQDEGHGFRGATNRLASNAATEIFLAEHLGGRAQTEMSDEVSARLAELTVDPATVTLAEAPEAAGAGTFDGAALAPFTASFDGTIEAMGQTFELAISRTVSSVGDTFVIVDAAESPMGAAVDSTVVASADLRPLSRRVTQGPVTVAFDYAPERVTGEIVAQGQTIPVDAALDAPLAVEGSSLYVGLGTLPLAEGYRAQFAGFDSQTQKPVTYTIEVTGTDSVEVPAGSFETFVVALTQGDGTGGGNGTLWVSQDAPGLLVKSEIGLGAQMGNGTSTTVLTAVE